MTISIHALLAESDGPDRQGAGCGKDFYPRSPCGERPSTCALFCSCWCWISIHALLAESDALGAVTSPAVSRFLSTLSLRRATAYRVQLGSIVSISIHALLAESDKQKCGNRKPDVDFYPRSPCGERPSTTANKALQKVISIHALLAESDGPG